MYIKEIEVENFRAFSGADAPYAVELGRHITCISGHNGTGKTTLLAILGNCGELKAKDGRHLNGKPFRGEYSDLIKGDDRFDNTGKKTTVRFEEQSQKENIPNGELSYRATFQKRTINETQYQYFDDLTDKDGKTHKAYLAENESYDEYRYRLIPIKTGDRKTESKVEWPSYYLGLSRLFPLGESDDIKEKRPSLDANIYEELISAHQEILNINEDVTSAIIASPAEVARKSGVGIETEIYGLRGNSSGQDNIGQIILSILSFQTLKNKLGERFNGGILVIDEIEATLHPAAQIKLYRYLLRKAIEIGIQVVFTTHSLHLLEYISKFTHTQNTAARLVYFTNGRGNLEIVSQPTFEQIKNDLLVTMSSYSKPKSIPVITEDDVARDLLKSLILRFHPDRTYHLEHSDTSIGCTELSKMAKLLPDAFQESIIIFDPDVKEGPNINKIKDNLAEANIGTSSSHHNALFLPGNKPIERLLWELMIDLPSSDSFYYEPAIQRRNIFKRSLVDEYTPTANESDREILTRCKAWYHQLDHQVREVLFNRWIDENEDDSIEFMRSFNKEYDQRQRATAPGI